MSIWEAFSYASAAVRQWYDQHGQLPTERPLLDDNGDGAGREAQNPGSDGTVARAVYLAPETAGTGDSALVKRREELQRQLDDLRVRKASSANPGQFDAEIEKILSGDCPALTSAAIGQSDFVSLRDLRAFVIEDREISACSQRRYRWR